VPIQYNKFFGENMDLMDMVKGAVSKQVMGQIGGILGTDEKKTSSVFENAAGSILGGLIKKSGTPQGARDVFEMAKKQDTGVLDKLGDLLGGGKVPEEFEKSGNNVLDGIFGGNSRGGIMATIAKVLGLDKGIMSKLMAMVAPIVMGVIGKHIKNKALDAVGLGSFLGEQKKSLGFMPSSLTEGLGFGNLLGNVTGAASDAVGAAGDAGKAALGAAGNAGRAAAGAAGDAADAGFNFVKLLLPLIALAALAFLAWQYLMPAAGDAAGKIGDGVKGAASGVVDGVKGAADGIGGAMSGMSIPGLEIPEGADFGDLGMGGLKDLSGKFTGITDGFKNVTADNASGLADKIKGLTGSIDGMGLANLPESGKGVVGGMIGKFIKTINDAMGGISDDGILGILKPVVKGLMDKLNPLAG
jgi:hypothetical protein